MKYLLPPLAVLAVSLFLSNHFDNLATVEPVAAFVPQTRAYEVTCGAAATSVKPTGWSTIHSVTCGLSVESPDDSAECVCIGGNDMNATDECFPVGGCARAIQATFAIDGSTYCMREDASDTVLVCLAGRGQP